MTKQRDDTELVRSYLEKGLPLPPGEYIVRETIVLPPSPEPTGVIPALEMKPVTYVSGVTYYVCPHYGYQAMRTRPCDQGCPP